jgi:hypothetical protein
LPCVIKVQHEIALVFTAGALLLLVSCGSPYNLSLKPDRELLDSTYTISGTITKSDGGNASGASVQL